MTPEQKRQYRLNKTLDTSGMKFPSPEAEKAYKTRTQRMVDVYNVREPDRVPVNLPVGNLPLRMAGVNSHSAMYDYEKEEVTLEAGACKVKTTTTLSTQKIKEYSEQHQFN